MTFSQSLRFGDKSLQELEEGVNYEVTKTPNRVPVPDNSDSDIIDESPTNCSVYSFRDRGKHKQLNKSRRLTLPKSKFKKSVSCEQLGTSKVETNVRGSTGLTQFFQSEYDFNEDILMQSVSKSKSDTEKVNGNAQSIADEHDMFDESMIPEDKQEPSPTVATYKNGNAQSHNPANTMWDDSIDLNDFDLDYCDEIKENSKANELNLKVDEHIALGLDNVTFTQSFLSEASFENDLNLKNGCTAATATSKFIEDELQSCKQSLNSAKRDECHEYFPPNSQPRALNLNSSSPNFTLNYSASSEESEVNNLMPRTSHTHLNSISSWGLPPSIVQEYSNKGIVNMFDWQRDCLSNSKILFENSNLVYCAPTSAGKTLVSEILMIKNVLEKKKKVLIILPFVSVVREKMHYLQDLLTSAGIEVEGYFGGYTPRNFDNVHVAVCTIEKANSIVNKLLEQNKINIIGCIVVDEVHLISDPSRGYIMELLLTKMLYVNKKVDTKIQIITMSATLPNLNLLTTWLGAEFYHTDFRPVELKEMIKINNEIFDSKMIPLRSVCNEQYLEFPKDQDNIGQLCVETILESCSVVVFCPSKDWCESLANHLANFIYHIGKSKTELGEKIRNQINFSLLEEAKAQLRNCPTGLDTVLEKTLSYGCAYHHAGLTSDERDIIESAFKLGSVRIIIATSTLSSGVNLPARRVIIRSPLFGGKTMNSLTYKQMIGRAGRTGKDTLGESILICNASNRRSGEDLISASLKPLTSCLDMDNCVNLKRAILEIIASGMATTKFDLEEFCNCTLLSSEKQIEFKYNLVEKEFPISSDADKIRSEDTGDEADLIGKCMQFLINYEFVRLQVNEITNETNFIATRLGNACLASSMPPGDGFLLFSELQKSRQCFVLETELHAVYLVTPFSICYQMQDIDWMFFLDVWEKLPASMRRVGELVGVKESFFVKAMRGHKLDYKALQVHKRFYTSLALQELVNEKHINEVAQKFRCSRGILQSLQQMASTFAGIVTSFCHALNWTMLATIISQFKERLFFGVHQDLVELMKIPNLNSQRARALFTEGILNLADLANSDVFTIEKAMYNSICFDSKKRDGENDWEADQRNNMRHLFVTGKSGLTIREVAKLLIDDARWLLQLEMGVENIVWATVSQNKSRLVEINESKTTNIATDVYSQQLKNPKNQMKRKPDKEMSGEYSKNTGEPLRKKLRITQETLLEQEQLSCRSFQFKDLNIVNVFGSLEFFNQFKEAVTKCSVIGVSIGINHIPIVAPVIGQNVLVDKIKTNEGKSYNCIFDEHKFMAGIALCLCDETAEDCRKVVYYLNLQSESKDDVNITFDMKINFLVDVFQTKHLTVVMFDAKEQCKALIKCFANLRRLSVQLHDPRVANWLLQPDVEGKLLPLVRQYAPEYNDIMQIVEIQNSSSIGLNYRSTISPRIRSSVESCVVAKILSNQLKQITEINPKIVSVFTDIEMPIQRTLLEMEIVGFPVDHGKISNLSSDLTDVLKSLEKKIFKMQGRSFNILSSKEVAKVLGIHSNNKITGKVSTAKQVLEKLNNPMADLIIQYRTVETTLKKNILPLSRQVVNNRIHPNSFSFTSTGRISMHEPNLQSVTNDFSVFTGEDCEPKTISCRQVFQVSSQNKFISADFCQLELRILTHFSGDSSLSKIMKTDCDVFKIIAAKWNHVNESDITEEQRNASKQICYGVIYGMGVKALAESLHCDESEAQRQLASFHECYPGIRMFAEKLIKRARENGFVETLSGRRRYLEHITSEETNMRAQAERIALNTTIQGTAADIAKCAMLEMEKCLDRNKTLKDANLVLHMHDELVYEAPKDIAEQVAYNLKMSMENCKVLNVPLRVKLKVGDTWGSMKVFEI